jgi:hypothetical protein
MEPALIALLTFTVREITRSMPVQDTALLQGVVARLQIVFVTMDSKNRVQFKPRASKKEKKRKKHGCCPRLTAVQRPKKNRLVV